MANKNNSFIVPFIISFILLGSAIFYTFFNDDVKEVDNEISEGEKVVPKKETVVLNEDEVEKEIVKNDKENKVDAENNEHLQDVGANTEPNYDKIYIEKYGEQSVLQARKNAALAVGLWIVESADIEDWKQVATKAYADKFTSQLLYSDAAIERNITLLDVVSSEPTIEKEMDFSVFATWEVKANGKIINEQRKPLTVHLKQENGIWLVDNIADFTNVR